MGWNQGNRFGLDNRKYFLIARPGRAWLSGELSHIGSFQAETGWPSIKDVIVASTKQELDYFSASQSGGLRLTTLESNTPLRGREKGKAVHHPQDHIGARIKEASF